LGKESKKNTFIKKYLQPNVGFSQIVVTETKETKTPLISGQIDEGNDLKHIQLHYLIRYKVY
jgi:hypothetical protein